jgi:hypothetical protein
MRISFNPLAERELNDASQYYELESSGLGAAFLAEVERACNALIDIPKRHRSYMDRFAAGFFGGSHTACSTAFAPTRYGCWQ